MTADKITGMSSLIKGLAAIEAFAEKDDKMTIADVARITNMSRASARRCLHTLAECGYLSYGGKYFEPTPRMFRLGSSYSKVATLPRIAQPILESAREFLGESISLTVLKNEFSVFVARANANSLVNIGLVIGSSLPAYSCATGRVLLSSYSADALKEYLKRSKPVAHTPKTLTDIRKIQKVIEAVQTTNYAITDEELELGMNSIATPVRGTDGQIVAAISASSLTGRMTLSEMTSKFLPVLTQAAEQLERAL